MKVKLILQWWSSHFFIGQMLNQFVLGGTISQVGCGQRFIWDGQVEGGVD